MHCANCGAVAPAETAVCGHCGAQLSLACPGCGTAAVAGAHYCVDCGTRLPEAGSARMQAQSHVDGATHMLENQVVRHDELKNVTVLFADVTNSTGLIEGLSPEAAKRLLQPALMAMTDAVHAYGGVVSKLQGDGLMALFGAPVALEDHALRACRAALDMQKAETETLRIHIGLNTGLVLVRSVDTNLFMEYDPVGWTVHMAARMGEMAEPGEIRLTGSTAEQVEGFVTMNRLGAARIRGVRRRIATYLLTGLSGERTRWEARRMLGLNRFVGRKRELGALEQALLDLGRGKGGVYALSGEAGIGKSRLLYELEHGDKCGEARVLYAAAQSDGAEMAFLLIRQLLRSWLGGSGDSPDQQVATLGIALAALLPNPSDRQMISPAMMSLLDLPVPDQVWRDLDAFERRQAIQQALRIWIRGLAQKSPLVVIFEDLHWIDPESEAILQMLCDLSDELPVLFLMSFRVEYRWRGRPPEQIISVPRLPEQSALTLLDEILGIDPSLDPLKQVLVHRAGGTPLFRADVTIVCITTAGKPARLPAEIRALA